MKSKNTIMKTIILLCSFIFCCTVQAQIKSEDDATEYRIAQKIDEKAKKVMYGAVHSESAKMRRTAGAGGWFLRYEKGWVYYNPKTKNAHAIKGDIMTKWGQMGYENGWLGFPTSDVALTPTRTGSYIHFDNGSIYWGPNTGTHTVGGAFRTYWKNAGWENSASLGFPKTDEIEIFFDGYTRYQQFEKGTLFFAPGKEVLYSNNPNATTPPQNTSQRFSLQFFPDKMNGSGDKMVVASSEDLLDLYGWMDLRVYKGNGTEITEESNKSFSLFYIPEQNRIDGFKSYDINYAADNIIMQRTYNITQDDITANAYIRVTYWLNDHDGTNSNDYLKLYAFNGTWNYNKGNHPYREIKLKDIQNSNDNLIIYDKLADGTEHLFVSYKWKLVKK